MLQNTKCNTTNKFVQTNQNMHLFTFAPMVQKIEGELPAVPATFRNFGNGIIFS